MNVLKQVLLSLGCVVMLGCNNDDDKPKSKPDSATIKEVKTTYAKIAFANYEDALTTAKKLQTTINTFVGTPTEDNFKKAKKAWYDARAPYSLTEAYRFSDGPIDNIKDDGDPDTTIDEGKPEVWMNSWPLDESFVDYVVYNEERETNKSFINDTDFTISKESLKEKNMPEGPDDAKVSIGYHAIEFLLWGQDTETPVDIADGGDEHNTDQNTGGKRSYLDYVVGTTNYQLNGDGTTFIIKKGDDAGDSIQVANKERRGKYLKTCAELLIDDLQSVLDQWDSSKSNNYYAEFMKMSDKVALKTMMTGIGTLANSELADERIKAAISLAEEGKGIQEDEHDCFSDDSYRTIRFNLQSCINLYKGTYTRIDGTVVKGPSLKDFGAKLTGDNAEVYKSVNADFDKAKKDIDETHIPFDFGVSNESTRVKFSEVYKDLKDLGKHFSSLAAAFGINISIDG